MKVGAPPFRQDRGLEGPKSTLLKHILTLPPLPPPANRYGVRGGFSGEKFGFSHAGGSLLAEWVVTQSLPRVQRLGLGRCPCF